MSLSGTESYKRYSGEERWDVIVVGSGMGGMTAAMLLAKHAGKRVLVLERHYVAGGFTHAFSRPGYDWDVGVHYIGDVGRPEAATRRMFDHVTAGRLQWAPLPEVYDRIMLGDRSYDIVAGKQRFRERMIEYFPSEAFAIDAYLEKVREASRAARGYFTEKAVPAPVAFLAGGFLRRKFMRFARRTTREVLEELTSNQELIGVLTGQFGDYGLPPGQSSFGMHAMLVNHYLGGAWYPVGGASAIAEGVIPEIVQRGGKILINAEVTRIVVERGRATGVEMADGRRFKAPLVISNTGASVTYGKLLTEGNEKTQALRRTVEELGSSAAHVCLYLGLNGTDADLGTQGTNLWIYPDADHDKNIARFLADHRNPIPLTYISFPSFKDPDFQRRHPGHSTVEVLTLASFDSFAPWNDKPWMKRGDDYVSLKHEFKDRLLAILYDHVPKLKGHVDVCEISSPLSTRKFVNYPNGEIYGLRHAPARFLDRSIKPRTPIKGLYLTGQDVCTCGVAGAMFAGAMTASAALGRPILQRIMKG